MKDNLVNKSGDLVNDLVNDTISRAAALTALGEEPPVWYDGEDEIAERDQWRRDVAAIKALPSAQLAQDLPKGCTDTISRQAAINAICEDGTRIERQGRYSMTMVERKQRDVDILDNLPPAQPDIETLLRLAVAMAKPIEYLNLSVRSYNALKRRGVDSVAKVYELKWKENLKKIRNIGAKSADEIEDCLSAYLAQWEGGHDERSD